MTGVRDWESEYDRQIETRIGALEGRVAKVEERLRIVEDEQTKLRIKIGIWAAAGAALPSIAAYVLQLLR